MAGNIPIDSRRRLRQQASADELLAQGTNPPVPNMYGSSYPPQTNWGMPNYGNQNNFALDASQFSNWGNGYKPPSLSPNPATDYNSFNYGLDPYTARTGLQNNSPVPVAPSSGFDLKATLGSDAFKNSIAALSGALQAYGGYKQLQLSKDMFNFQKDAFERQYGDQMRMVNEDRAAQKATLSSWNR